MRLVLGILLGAIASCSVNGQTYTISTFAGKGNLQVNVPGTSAILKGPDAVAVDKAGNIFFADNCAVYRQDATTGIVTAFAGTGVCRSGGDGGPATSATMITAAGLAVDGLGNLYISDDRRVRKVSNGVISTVAGTGQFGPAGVQPAIPYGDNGPATSAPIYPWGIAVDSAGNLYISDTSSGLVRKVTNGIITTVAGANVTRGVVGVGDNGPATATMLQPQGIAVDSAGNLYIADTGHQRIRKVSNGIITTVAGNGAAGFSGDNGPATSAMLSSPGGVAVDSTGNLYIVDLARIRKVSNGVITTVAGNGTSGFSGDNGPATTAQIGAETGSPQGIAVDSAGSVYITDDPNRRVRRISSGAIATVAGGGTSFGDNGPPTNATLGGPKGVAVGADGSVYIAETANHRIRKVSNGVITTIAGAADSTAGFSGDNGPAASALLNSPESVAVDSGNVYVGDAGNHRIRKISNGLITTIAGNGTPGLSGDNGPATSAALNDPIGIAVDAAGNLYVADFQSPNVRRISNGTITTVAGNGTRGFSGDGGPATSASLDGPNGVALDAAGNLYVSDYYNARVRKVSGGVITTLATAGGIGLAGLAVDSSGNVFLADDFNGGIYKVSAGAITLIAGSLTTYGFGGDNGPATNAYLYFPNGIAVNSTGDLYIADTSNGRVRVLRPDSSVLTITSLSPHSAMATATGFNLTVNGTGFAPGATVEWNGTALPTTFLTVTQLTASVSAALISSPGSANVVVLDPDGTASSPSVFTVNYPVPTITGLNPGSAPAAGVGFSLIVNGTGFVSGATVQWNGAALPTTFVSSAQLSALVSASLIATNGSAGVVVANPGGTISNTATIPISPLAPAINQGGIIPVVQAGSWISIYGTNLASGVFSWNGDFPISLGSTSVTINSKAAYLSYVSPTQINLQAPDDTTLGSVNVVVTTPNGSASSTVTLAQASPVFSLFGDGKHAAGFIPTPDGSGFYAGGTYDLLGPSGAFAFNTRPVKQGETLVLFGVAFGPTTPFVPAGQIFSGAAPTSSPVTITIGGVRANVLFAGITAAGLYQFNLVVPNVSSGDQPLEATVNGYQTPAGAFVSVQ